MNEKLLNLEKTTASVLSVLLLIYGWKLLINNITYSQKFRTTLHKMVLLEVVVHFFGNKDIPARSIHLWIIKAYFRQSYMEENPIWKKILYGRKSKIDKKVLSAVLFIHKIYLFISIVVNNVVSWFINVSLRFPSSAIASSSAPE